MAGRGTGYVFSVWYVNTNIYLDQLILTLSSVQSNSPLNLSDSKSCGDSLKFSSCYKQFIGPPTAAVYMSLCRWANNWITLLIYLFKSKSWCYVLQDVKVSGFWVRKYRCATGRRCKPLPNTKPCTNFLRPSFRQEK